MPKQNCAVIFDMDGVIADNLQYHKLAWQAFFKHHKLVLSDKLFDTKMNGCTNAEILRMIFKRELSKKEIVTFTAEKENVYRKIFKPHLKPVPGLINFLKALRKLDIKVAVATAAPPDNVRFVLNGTKTKKFFTHIVDDANIQHGKPHPEVFLKAAKKIKTPPKRCVVFEDAFLGIQAAKRAKMKTVGVATTYSIGKLQASKPDFLIKDFRGLKPSKILAFLTA